jgi:DNA primase
MDMTQIHSQEYNQNIRMKVDIMEVIEKYIPLKKKEGKVVGLCPFHYDRQPTFEVDLKNQTFHCSKCKASGDAFDFVSKINKRSIKDTQETVFMVNNNSTQGKDVELPEEDSLNQMYEAHDLVAKLYHYVLTETPQGKVALKYLLDRGLTRETIDEFQLGYAPKEWEFVTTFLQNRNFDVSVMVNAGLLSRNDHGRIYDRFRGRIMFPIHDENGRIVAFGGRALDSETNPKYLNSPDTPIFQKGETVFNLHRVKHRLASDQPLILFEGYMDVITVWQAGFHQGVATLGTSLTPQQVKKILDLTDQALICYDGDKAGQEATQKAIEHLTRLGCNVQVAKLPNEIDPDEYIKMYGANQFGEKVLKNSLTLAEYHTKRLQSQYNLSQIDEFAQYVTSTLQVIHSIADETEKRKLALRIAQDTEISPDILQDYYNKIPT